MKIPSVVETVPEPAVKADKKAESVAPEKKAESVVPEKKAENVAPEKKVGAEISSSVARAGAEKSVPPSKTAVRLCL